MPEYHLSAGRKEHLGCRAQGHGRLCPRAAARQRELRGRDGRPDRGRFDEAERSRDLDKRCSVSTQSSWRPPKSAEYWRTTRYPAEFLYQNLMIEANVTEAAHRLGVNRILFFGSSCIYPRLAPQPMTRRRSADRRTRANERSGMPSPRSPASSCAKPIAGNMVATTSRRCRQIFTALATISTC